ncbi:Uncharacterised protein [uncultured archaeon]|nr:Uncharacterised protein [uncultured archaeon]
MVDLTSIVGNLQRLGFYDFVLPWLLFFAVILGVLTKVAIFGDEKDKSAKQVNAIIAAVLAFFIVNFTPVGGISAYYSTLFGSMAQILATLVILIIFIGVLGFDKTIITEKNKEWYSIIFIALVLFAAVVFSQASGGSISLGLSSDDITIGLVFLFIIAVIGFATKGEGKSETEAPKPPPAHPGV